MIQPEHTADAALPARDRAVISVLLVATFVVILNETLLNVALPTLMTELRVSTDTVQWLATAFLLTMGVVIPVTGWLLQRLRTRQVFTLAMTLFCSGTLLAALAPTFGVLLLARVVQAGGTAVMLPLLVTSVLTLVPPRRRGGVMGNISIVISVAPAIGPALSGLILQVQLAQVQAWRLLFAFVLPVALAALVFGTRTLRDIGQQTRVGLDGWSVPLAALGFGGLVYGLSGASGPGGVGSPAVVWPLLVSVISLLLFGVRQVRLQRTGAPLLDLRVFRSPAFSLGVSLMVIAMMALFGGAILLPLYLQNIRGLNTLQTGLLLLPGGLLMGLLAPGVGQLYDRFGPRWLVTPGTVLMAVVLWRLGSITALTPIWTLLGLHLLLSAGLALLFTPVFTIALSQLPPALYSHGSAALSTLQQVAGAVGTALLVTVMTGQARRLALNGAAPGAAQDGGLQLAFTVAAGVAALAVVLALFMQRPAVPAASDEPQAVSAD